MDQRNIKLFADILGNENYVKKAIEKNTRRQSMLNSLLSQKCLPVDGWSDEDIKWLLDELSCMDMNNQQGQIGVGEREGRIASKLVYQRHFGFSHGIGRSGDIAENQPKAIGSSLLYKLANKLVLSSLKIAGISKKAVGDCIIFPMATGLTLSFCMQLIKSQNVSAKYVIWPRIDQKSCFKAIIGAGLQPVIIENLIEGDEIRTDIDSIEKKIIELGANNIACIYTTTSCFAPRVPDRLVQVSTICKNYNIPHLVNNAYGVQSTRCLGLLSEACTKGRVDYFVQSTDKNYMVPVGGSIIASPSLEKIEKLTIGIYKRTKLFEPLSTDERNQATLSNLRKKKDESMIGPMLYLRNVSGARSVNPSPSRTIEGYNFQNWCQHINFYFPESSKNIELVRLKSIENDLNNLSISGGEKTLAKATSYLNVAVAIGFKEEDIDLFIEKLISVLDQIY
ncbi:O-phosphoseryl-tRNA(Sec) selenium transferase [Smittium culicis]|uniref:O-phosphoseryl-tRNA(Sec) selenium transferase n=1 Tax=Smittium culicis TaxID=133412 RepID=A0A1R1YEZ8_9FUNG|nr:O-phosphoseryl-tRNA(Sec) selenium transferase [Smittium culicis]